MNNILPRRNKELNDAIQQIVKTWKSNKFIYSFVSWHRCSIFQPQKLRRTKDDKLKKYILENKWGKIEVVSATPITQVHCDLLEGMMLIAKKRFYKDGTIGFLFSPTELKKIMGWQKYSTSYILNFFEDLQLAIISITSKQNKKITNIKQQILWSVDYQADLTDQQATIKIRRIKKYKDKSINMIHIKYSQLFTFLCINDLSMIIYDSLNAQSMIKKLINLHDPLVQSFRRFCLTHDCFNKWKIDNILEAIGAISPNTDRRIKSKKRKKIMQYKKEIESFGIFLDSDMNVTRKNLQPHKIYYEHIVDMSPTSGSDKK
jgi:hypothetical protein